MDMFSTFNSLGGYPSHDPVLPDVVSDKDLWKVIKQEVDVKRYQLSSADQSLFNQRQLVDSSNSEISSPELTDVQCGSQPSSEESSSASELVQLSKFSWKKREKVDRKCTQDMSYRSAPDSSSSSQKDGIVAMSTCVGQKSEEKNDDEKRSISVVIPFQNVNKGSHKGGNFCQNAVQPSSQSNFSRKCIGESDTVSKLDSGGIFGQNVAGKDIGSSFRKLGVDVFRSSKDLGNTIKDVRNQYTQNDGRTKLPQELDQIAQEEMSKDEMAQNLQLLSGFDGLDGDECIPDFDSIMPKTKYAINI